MKKNKKKFVLITLLFLAIFMGIGYSLLQQQLKIEGNAQIKTNFDVEIVGIERYNNAGFWISDPQIGEPWKTQAQNAKEISEPTFTATTATFNVRLEPMSEITYLVTIENKGSIDAFFDSVNIETSGNVDVNVSAPIDVNGRMIGISNKVSYLVTLSYNIANDNEPNTSVVVNFNVKQVPQYEGKDLIYPTIIFAGEPYNYNTGEYNINLLNANFVEDNVNYFHLYVSLDDAEYIEVPRVDGDESLGSYIFNSANNTISYKVGQLSQGKHEIKLKATSYPSQYGMFTNEITLVRYVQ